MDNRHMKSVHNQCNSYHTSYNVLYLKVLDSFNFDGSIVRD